MDKNLIQKLEANMPEPAICLLGQKCQLGAMHPDYTGPLWYLINEGNSPGLGRVGPVGLPSPRNVGKEASISSFWNRRR